jgi:Holliday junction resolvasome RuvABC endonuclease subunit
MRIMGLDAGLTAPGFAVVETSEENLVGKIIHTECFIPEWDKSILKKTEQDVWRVSQIVKRVWTIVRQLDVNTIVAELPTGGAKSAGAIKGMAYSTSMTATAIEALKFFEPNRIMEVVFITPLENKKGGTGKKKWDIEIEQGKWEIMSSIRGIWPEVDTLWPKKKKKPQEVDDGLCWAISDALSCIATYLRKRGVSLPSLD